MHDIEAILDQVNANMPVSVEKFLQFLTFPSVSSQPDGREGVVACADWLRFELDDLGLEARVVKTDGASAGHRYVTAWKRRA